MYLPVQTLNLLVSCAHTISGQGSSSRSGPIHILPLFFGLGLVQVRVLDRNVFPHVCGHSLQLLHVDQPP